MGRVKDLWMKEREEAFNRRVKQYMEDGYTEDEAVGMANDDQEEEDEANSQFGVGA